MNRTRAEETASEDAPAPWGVVECAIPGGVLALVITWELTCPPSTHDNVVARIVTCVAFLLVVAYLLNRVRRRGLKELSEVRAVARAAQEVLLRPLPARLDGLAFSARQLSASRRADVGGDLYEAVATTYGVRVVIGDVRGHGLPAIGAVAAVLGSFREAAHDEPGLDGVLRRLDRAHQRHLRQSSGQEAARTERRRAGGRGAGGAGPGGRDRQDGHHGPDGRDGRDDWDDWDGLDGWGYDDQEPEGLSAEEFVTVLLLEIGPDAQVRALNCGHPWPYRLGRDAAPLATAEPLPPLGAFPLPAELPLQRCGPLLPGESLFLHTDGAEDARDSAGQFFSLEEILTEAASGTAGVSLPPAAVVRRVHAALLRHTGGRVTDDMALLVLRNDRPPVPAWVGLDPGVRGARRLPGGRTPGDPAPGTVPPDERLPDERLPGEPAPAADRRPESQLPHLHPSGDSSPDARPPERCAPGLAASDMPASDVPASDGHGQDAYVPGHRLPDTYAPEQRPRPRSGMTAATGVRTTSFRR